MIAELSAGIVGRDRMIDQLTRYLANDEALHIAVQGLAAGSFRQLQDATIVLCNGDSHAFRVMRRTVSSQQQLIRQKKALLRRGNFQCSLDLNMRLL